MWRLGVEVGRARAGKATWLLLLVIGAVGPPGLVLAQQAEPERPLSFTLRQQLLSDSNLLRLPEGVDPFPLTGVSARSDIISQTTARASYENRISGQRVAAYAEVGVLRYSNFTQFNNISEDIGGRWDWQYGRQWFGVVEARKQAFLNSFANQESLQKNVIDVDTLGITAGYRFTPSWSAFGKVDFFSRSNSASQLASADSEVTAFEIGARYDTQTGNNVSFGIRVADVRQPNRQVLDAAGNLLPVFIDNASEETRIFTRLNLKPTGASALTGELGFTQRKFENLPQRNFSGVTANLTYRYDISGSLFANAGIRRDISNADFIYASYLDARILNASLAWQATGKLLGRFNVEQRNLSFDGDPGFVNGLTALRRDTTRAISLGVEYEVLRRGFLSTQLRRDTRSSNFSGLNFTSTSALVAASFTF